jgi:FkbM family methyltransferase
VKNRLLCLKWVAALTRKYGVPRGLGRVINLLIPQGRPPGLYDVIFEFDEGLWLNINLNSFLDRRLYVYGYYSNKYVEHSMKKLSKEGNVVLDCGANIGMYSLRMAQSVGSQGKVIAIEPHDVARKRLEANIFLNDFLDRVTVIPCALSGSCGRTIFHYPPASHINQGNASFYRKGDDWQEKEVEVKTIDRIASELNLSRLDVIRCDVQGEEFNVLKGAENSIRSWVPTICIRYSRDVAHAANMEIVELTNYLQGLGYSAFINKREVFAKFLVNLSVGDAELLFIHDPAQLLPDRIGTDDIHALPGR